MWTAKAVLVSAILLSGCAITTTMVATGGSRADGTVNLSYEYGEFQRAIIDQQQGQQTAVERCKAWGYTGAEPFGGQVNRCEAPTEVGCAVTQVTVTYQCMGTPASP